MSETEASGNHIGIWHKNNLKKWLIKNSFKQQNENTAIFIFLRIVCYFFDGKLIFAFFCNRSIG